MKKTIGIFAIAVLGGLVALGINSLIIKEKSYQSIAESQNAQFTNTEKLSDIPSADFVAVASVSTPAVVHIKNTMAPSRMQPEFFDPFGFFEAPNFQRPPQQSTGSGVLITADGYIATNNHVVAGTQKIEVTLDDKRTYVAEVVGTDPETDLALLKIDEKNLPFIKFGNSDEVRVGEWAVAVGNPFNLTSTVTAGIISAKGRNINLLRQNGGEYAIENFIQTDAAVNPGNSGGALVNTRGELIGINTAIASQTGSYAGYAFAIPINLAKKVLDDLLKYGEVKRAILGVRIQDITQELADEVGLKELKGVYIPQVQEGGAADKGDMENGDVILSIDGEAVNKSSELQEVISKYYPGDKVKVKVLRGGKEKTLNITLLSREGKDEIDTSFKRAEAKVLGSTLENLSRSEKLELKIRNGVRVAELGEGPLKAAGIPKGWIITQIDKSPVFTTQDVQKQLENKSGAVLVEGINSRGGKEAYAVRIN